MIYNMYAVKDELNNKFMNPMFVEAGDYAEPNAIRQFKSNVNNIQLWKDNADDFSLYFVGQFDDEVGANAVMVTKVVSGRSVLNAD